MIEDFFAFVEEMGGLHDSNILDFSFSPLNKEFKLKIVDIYSNFLGLPEYPGKTYGEIIFKEVQYFSIAIESNDQLKIYDFLISGEKDSMLTILFSPQGSINLTFKNVHFPERNVLNMA